MEGKETEPGQSHPTILLYDDMTKFKNITDESKKEYTVTITLDGASEKEVVPPTTRLSSSVPTRVEAKNYI